MALALMAQSAMGANLMWSGPAGGDWFDGANWAGGSGAYPQNNDIVAIGGGSVLLSNETAALASFSISNATLTFTNWATVLRATAVTVSAGGILTLPPAFTTNEMSNRIYVICQDFSLDIGGSLNANARGYASDNGPGKGGQGYGGGGGGYGGKGGRGLLGAVAGSTYGSIAQPLEPGSAGGRYDAAYLGKKGGGAVRIDASGTVTVNSTITADGEGGNTGGSGSGGSIYISCNTFGGGTNGLLRANGGWGGGDQDGCGGGGRIAVQYENLAGTPGIRFSADRGVLSSSYGDDPTGLLRVDAEMGTVSFTDAQLLDCIFEAWGGIATGLYGNIYLQSGTVWTSSYSSAITITNSTLGIPASNRWRFADDLILSSGKLVVDWHGVLSCAESLVLTNGGQLVVYAGPTNTGTASCGALVEVTKTLTVATNSWIYPYSNPTNGGSALFEAGTIIMQAGSGFNADGRGYTRGYGPGKGTDGYGEGGGGYGGLGGYCSTESKRGAIYGSTNAPTDAGSGGGSYGAGYPGGFGGGMVRIDAGNIDLMGIVSACGTSTAHAAGAGSGGGIFVACGTLRSAPSAVLRADGGNGRSGDLNSGGGGGRIAVWIGLSEGQRARVLAGDLTRLIVSNTFQDYLGTLSVNAGTGTYYYPHPYGAQAGTAWFIASPPNGAMVFIR